MSHLFKQPDSPVDEHEYKIALSDIIAGMILVQRKQREDRLQQELHKCADKCADQDGREIAGEEGREGLVECIESYPQPESWMTVTHARRYMKFAWGVYGWKYYLFRHLVTAPCRLFRKCICCYTCRQGSQDVWGDGCCRPNTAAFIDLTELPRNELFFSIWKSNEIDYKPFAISLYNINNSDGAVVVSIRGTLSAADAITDADATPVGVCDEDSPILGKCFAHKGIYRAARFMVDCTLLEDQSIMAGEVTMKAMEVLPEPLRSKNLPSLISKLKEALEKEPEHNPNYNVKKWPIVITGHSLGAGLATLITIILKSRQEKQNLFRDRDIRCFAFSPPGWSISENLSVYCNQSVLSVVCGFDMVPRSGLVTFNVLKKDILKEILQCSQRKVAVFRIGCQKLFSTRLADYETKSMVSNESDNLTETDSSFKRDLWSMVKDAENSRTVAEKNKLYFGGQVLYMKKHLPPNWKCMRCSSNFSCHCKCCTDTIEYRPVWARPSHFNRVLIGAYMISDHAPDTVYDSLDQAFYSDIDVPSEQVMSCSTHM